jgi:RNA polymerase sigma-70 factor (ECF subfamily)
MAAVVINPATSLPMSESAAWEQAVWVHARLLYRIAFAALRHHQDAEDAVQETLQRAWKYRHRLAQVDDTAAWLARIAWRVAKARRPRPGLISVEQLNAVSELRASGVGADEMAASRELRGLTEHYIQCLPAKLRQPLVLSTVQELSAREVGLALGIPEATVRTRCLRARRLLREKLDAALGARKEGSHGSR